MWFCVFFFVLIMLYLFFCGVLDRILISIGESFGVSDKKHLLNVQSIFNVRLYLKNLFLHLNSLQTNFRRLMRW